MTQQEQNAWDGTLGFGLLLVIILEVPMGLVMFGHITIHHHETLIKEATIGIGLIGFLIMCFLFFRTGVRVMYHE